MPLSSTKDLTVGLQDPKMSQNHPDLAAEQAHIDHAYACLEKSKTDAWRIRDLNEASTGGTFQARYERNLFDEQLLQRLTHLDLGDAALVWLAPALLAKREHANKVGTKYRYVDRLRCHRLGIDRIDHGVGHNYGSSG